MTVNLKRRTWNQADLAPCDEVESLGELHPLLVQLGSFDGLVTLNAASTSLAGPAVESFESLAIFLEAYRSQILLPLDLPAIHRAFNHASRNETRELIALDLEVARQPVLKEFASASQRVGKCQLQRLRPLRDARVVQRYLTAVEAGRSHAWHTVVYGLTLAVYSLPILQGLMSYARQTLQGFIHAAARPLRVSERSCRKLMEELCADLPRHMEALLSPVGAPQPPRK